VTFVSINIKDLNYFTKGEKNSYDVIRGLLLYRQFEILSLIFISSFQQIFSITPSDAVDHPFDF